jgi:hypothetical protein
MDLTDVASNKAAMQAVAEGKSRLSNHFARNLLLGTTNLTASKLLTQFAASAALSNAGDYTLTYRSTTTATEIRVVADGVAARGIKGTNSSNWTLPQ